MPPPGRQHEQHATGAVAERGAYLCDGAFLIGAELKLNRQAGLTTTTCKLGERLQFSTLTWNDGCECAAYSRGGKMLTVNTTVNFTCVKCEKPNDNIEVKATLSSSSDVSSLSLVRMKPVKLACIHCGRINVVQP